VVGHRRADPVEVGAEVLGDRLVDPDARRRRRVLEVEGDVVAADPSSRAGGGLR
jgi:3-methyladenine DNA glycosylase Mpg